MADVYEYDHATGLTVEREFTEEELAQLEIDKEAMKAVLAEEAAKAAAKTAILEKLNLTEEELKVVLG